MASIFRRRKHSLLAWWFGVQPLLDAVVEYLPSPLDRPAIKGVDMDDAEKELIRLRFADIQRRLEAAWGTPQGAPAAAR